MSERFVQPYVYGPDVRSRPTPEKVYPGFADIHGRGKYKQERENDPELKQAIDRLSQGKSNG